MQRHLVKMEQLNGHHLYVVYHPQGPLRVCSGVSAVSGTWTDERRDLPDAGRASRESPPSLTTITSALLPGAGPNPSSEA